MRGETVAIDGSKFRAVSSAQRVRERDAVKRYLEQLDRADEQEEWVIDPSAVAAALEKLKQDPEPEARFMRTTDGERPAYNVQLAVDAEHGLIVAQQVTTESNDERSLLPMAEAAKHAVGDPASLNVVADAGYSNGEQAQACEAQGIVPHVPVQRGVNNRGDGSLFDRSQFTYDENSDTLRCPAQQILRRKQLTTPQKAGGLYGFAANLWELSAEVAMHQRATTFRAASPLRRGLATHAAAREGRDHAMAPLSGGTSLRRAQVPHLRPSTIPATRTDGSADRNEPGHLGLQPETHAEGAGWSCLPDSAGLLTKQAHLRATTPTP